jgi:DNA-binding NarL/FixJ family response regulator
MTSVLIADDQELVRVGLRKILENDPQTSVAGEANNGEDAVSAATRLRPDVVLMDIRMPVMDGIESTRGIIDAAAARGGTQPRVIVLTTFDLDEAAARAIRAGASGFLLKDTDPEFLLAAIRTVHSGTSVIAASATRELFEHFGSATLPAPERFGTLTSREREIFLLAARGLSNSEIAAREYLSEATVKTHISRVLGKLELRDRVQLVVFAYEHGIV